VSPRVSLKRVGRSSGGLATSPTSGHSPCADEAVGADHAFQRREGESGPQQPGHGRSPYVMRRHTRGEGTVSAKQRPPP
jgi:hypothetical protein